METREYAVIQEQLEELADEVEKLKQNSADNSAHEAIYNIMYEFLNTQTNVPSLPGDEAGDRWIIDNKDEALEYDPMAGSVKIAGWRHYETDVTVDVWISHMGMPVIFGVQIDSPSGMINSLPAESLNEASNLASAVMYILVPEDYVDE